MVNSLYNIKKLVFEDKKYTLEELTDALINNFGFKNADEIGSFSLEAQENVMMMTDVTIRSTQIA